jgi:hypothetical protein
VSSGIHLLLLLLLPATSFIQNYGQSLSPRIQSL